MFTALKSRLAALFVNEAPRRPTVAAREASVAVAMRAYNAAKASRLTSGWAITVSSADSELRSSLTNLRSRSRALVRDAAYAKRAKVIIQNNVVGSGIGMQAQVMSSRDTLREAVNDSIEEGWQEWIPGERCHTGGTLHFSDLERAAMGQVFEAGEVLIRKHYRAFGDSTVPFALEMIEAERIADESRFPLPMPAQQGAIIRMGVEVDRFFRPLAYYLTSRHPGDMPAFFGERDRIERVPADQIIHLKITDRWPQTRGEPWLHTVIRKLNDMDAYSEAEIIAARGAANYLAAIESADPDTALIEKAADGTAEFVLEPGETFRLNPGEKLNFVSPNRPNPAMDPFMRMMLREVAAGAGMSYESLSRDYSQSNYSSSRLALLDDRDLWRCLQQWFLRAFRVQVHREWLRAAVLSGAVPAVPVAEYVAAPKKFEAVRFKPRGWGWVDPTKEVEAFKEAEKAGYTTKGRIISATADGADHEDIMNEIEQERRRQQEKGLVFDTDPEVFTKAAPEKSAAPPPDPGTANEPKTNDPPARVVSFGRP